MDTVEQGLRNIDKHHLKAIEKHKELYAKTVFDSATHSNISSKNLDLEFNKHFPEIDSIGIEEETPFNPTTVIQLGEVYKEIETWNKDDGLLPNRKVMGEYYIDTCEYRNDTNKYYCKTHNKGFPNFNNGYHLNGNTNNVQLSAMILPCGCNLWTSNNTIIINAHLSETPDIKRGIDKPLFMPDKSYTLEVDNYLNLYHKETGLYLMFNKTAFPMIPFYFKDKVIYSSKRIEQFKNEKLFTKEYQKSRDSREEFLEDIKQIIPDNYNDIFTFFNRFRQFKSFKYEVSEEEHAMKSIETDEELDLRDNLIESYKLRLTETVNKAENAERIMKEMIEEYEKQSGDIKTLHFQIEQLKQECIEKELVHKQEVSSLESKENLKYIEIIETLKTKNFRLNQHILEGETHKTNLEALGISNNSMKKQTQKIQLEINKVRNMNDRLITQIKNDKIASEKIKEEANNIKEEFLSNETEMVALKTSIKELKELFTEKEKECNTLTTLMKTKGETSSNALENALTDKIELLEIEKNDFKELNIKFSKENKDLSKQLEKYKKTISGLLN